MPIIKSAIKRVKTSEKANSRNSSQLSKMRTAVTAGADNIEELYQTAVSAVDKAASKGLIKANKAARDKSRMAARLNK